MKKVCLASVFCLFLAEVASAQGLRGWVNLDNLIVVSPLGDQPIQAAGLDLQSPGEYLIPVPPGDPTASAAPFTFFLSNTPVQITYGNLGTAVTIDDRLILSAGYDLESAILDGVDPCGDLSEAWSDVVAPTTPSFCTIPGDVDFDGKVTFDDFLIFSDNFGITEAVWPDGDFNWDRRVQFSDFLLLSANFDKQLEFRDPVVLVPEPSGLTFCLFWLMGLACFTREFSRPRS